MKLVCLADTHCNHWELTMPEGDILVFAGDMCGYGRMEEVVDFNTWLGTLDYRNIIVIAGNHDWTFSTQHNSSIEALSNATYLQDSCVEIDGIKIYGTPWQPAFNKWAFNLYTSDELQKKWDLIPNDTDILVTHCPPYGVLDVHYRSEKLGCGELLKAVHRVKPILHVFGHIHTRSTHERIGKTLHINASVVDGFNCINGDPVEVEI